MSYTTSMNALTVRWAAARSGGGSTVLSGAGVWPLLALLAAGADGATRRSLEEATGLDAATAAATAAGAAREAFALLGSSPAVRSALGLWTHRSLPLHPAWSGALPPGAHAHLTGDVPVDQKALDAWTAEHTGGLVPGFPIALTPSTALVLAGAVTVRTAWERPFTEVPGHFGGSPVPSLRRNTPITGNALVADTPAGPLTMVLVTGGDDIDVHLLLGEESRGPAALLPAAANVLSGGHPATPADALPAGARAPGLTVELVESSVDHLVTTLPRFTVRADHDLLALPEVFGLARGAEDFPGISAVPLAVAEARQNAMATFQAEGFEAAAVSAVAMAPTGAPPPARRARRATVVFDRPFGFLNVHRPTGLILTAGWVAAP